MKVFRALLLGLLCFAISMQGFAHIAMPKKPCPMHQSDAVVATMAANDYDCCNDADTFARTGKACKTGQECPASNGNLVTPFQTTSFAPVATLRFASPSLAKFDFAPAGVWRPPASL